MTHHTNFTTNPVTGTTIPPAWNREAPTAKQTEYLADLIRKKVADERWVEQAKVDLASGQMSKARTSVWISWFLSMPTALEVLDPWQQDAYTPEQIARAQEMFEAAQALSAEADAKADADETLLTGVYELDNVLYRVAPSRRRWNKGQLEASSISFYQGRPRYHRTARVSDVRARGRRVTVDEARKYGLESGWCLVCGLELTDPTSKARGIGPVCEKTQGRQQP